MFAADQYQRTRDPGQHIQDLSEGCRRPSECVEPAQLCACIELVEGGVHDMMHGHQADQVRVAQSLGHDLERLRSCLCSWIGLLDGWFRSPGSREHRISGDATFMGVSRIVSDSIARTVKFRRELDETMRVLSSEPGRAETQCREYLGQLDTLREVPERWASFKARRAPAA